MIGAAVSARSVASPRPDQEMMQPGEKRATNQILAVLEREVRASKTSGGLALRDAHAKAHGCVLAHMRVRDDLAEPYRIALFAQPHTYEAIVRFSNGNEHVRSDALGDGRGMAVKLIGVPGRKLLPNEERADTQDFLAINFPVFFIQGPGEYLPYVYAQQNGRLDGFLQSHPRTRDIVYAMLNHTVEDVLQERYFSETSYRLGDRYMKFAFFPEPCADAKAAPAASADQGSDYLRGRMKAQLAAGPACFSLNVQLQHDRHLMPVEDPTIEWSATLSPFVPVADLHIDSQTYDTAERNAFCETLSYQPWHSLPELRPVGSINRMRRRVYLAIQTLRHRLNDAPQEEPTADDFSALEKQE